MRDKKDRVRMNEGQRGWGRKVRYTEEGFMRDKKDGGTRMRDKKDGGTRMRNKRRGTRIRNKRMEGRE
jgi:hypothetical protein